MNSRPKQRPSQVEESVKTFDVVVYLKSGKSLVNIYPLNEPAVSNMQHILANNGRIDIQTGEDQVTCFHTSSVDYLVLTEILEEKTL